MKQSSLRVLTDPAYVSPLSIKMKRDCAVNEFYAARRMSAESFARRSAMAKLT